MRSLFLLLLGSTANVVLYQRAKLFSRYKSETFNLDANKLKGKITSKTKAIIVVHLFGLCADMDEILSIAGDIPVIEIVLAPQVHPKKYLCRWFRNARLFSSQKVNYRPGEGGMITTNDHTISENLNVLRNHGASLSGRKTCWFKPFATL